ncbi:MAG: TetR/AcrR family transcriptional regulator [Streptosporangiaceae bacterium]|jgi:AcrR family transcriptional regulator
MDTTTSPQPALPQPPVRRRDQQKEQTRLDLSLAAFELAKEHGLAGVRVPQIAAATGVSPRTFNNYFASKEAAIAWPATWRAARLAARLAARPPQEPLADALTATMAGMYEQDELDGLPPGWLRDFRALVATEPALYGEYLKAAAAAETALAAAIARRTGADEGQLEPQVLAAVVTGAERAAVLHWARHTSASLDLIDVVRTAIGMAVRGMASGS